MLFIGTGSEVELCMNAAQKLFEEGVSSRVVSMPCMEIFEAQSCEYQESIIPASISKRLVVEAGSSFGWFKYYGCDGDIVAIDTFGSSGPAPKVFEKYGFSTDNVVAKAKAVLAK
jgi:transketolase